MIRAIIKWTRVLYWKIYHSYNLNQTSSGVGYSPFLTSEDNDDVCLRLYRKNKAVKDSRVQAVFEVKHSCRSKYAVVSAELSVCRHRLCPASHQEQPTGLGPAKIKNQISNNK